MKKKIVDTSTDKDRVISTLKKMNLEYSSTTIQEKNGTLAFLDKEIFNQEGYKVFYNFYASGYFRREIHYPKRRKYSFYRDVAIYQLNDVYLGNRILEKDLISMLNKTISKIKSYRYKV